MLRFVARVKTSDEGRQSQVRMRLLVLRCHAVSVADDAVQRLGAHPNCPVRSPPMSGSDAVTKLFVQASRACRS